MAAPNSPNHVVNYQMKDSFIEQAKKKKKLTLIASASQIKILTLKYEVFFLSFFLSFFTELYFFFLFLI